VTREYHVALLLCLREWFRPWQTFRDSTETDDLLTARRDKPKHAPWTADPKTDTWKMPCGCRGTEVRGRQVIPSKIPLAAGEVSWDVPYAWLAEPFCPVCLGSGLLMGRDAEHYRLQAKRNKVTPSLEIDPWVSSRDLDYTVEEDAVTAYSAEKTRELVLTNIAAEEDLLAREIIFASARWNERKPLDEMPRWLRVGGSFDELETQLGSLERLRSRAFDAVDGELPTPWSAAGLRWIAKRMPTVIRVPTSLLDIDARRRRAVLGAKGYGTSPILLKMRDDELRLRRSCGETPQEIRQSLAADGISISDRQLRNILNGRKDRPLGVQGRNGRGVKRMRQDELERIARRLGELWWDDDRQREQVDAGREPLASKPSLDGVRHLYWDYGETAPVRPFLCRRPLGIIETS